MRYRLPGAGARGLVLRGDELLAARRREPLARAVAEEARRRELLGEERGELERVSADAELGRKEKPRG